ncbi:hypothetical protein F6X40_29785 [Paraburkholderia sp. UCT31]|nr:hypothetical protein [Paraburkholderia sp. UCT31]
MQSFLVSNESAFISYYDEQTQQIKFCVVQRAHVQSAIDRALTIPVPPDAPENSDTPITDEDARKLGSMAMLCHTKAHPELRARRQVTTEAPLVWTQVKPSAE